MLFDVMLIYLLWENKNKVCFIVSSSRRTKYVPPEE